MSDSGCGTASYSIASNNAATVTIADDDTATPAVVNVMASQNAAEPAQYGYYTFVRDVTVGTLTVYYQIDYSSTASGYSDYSAPYSTGSVTFAAGASSVTLNVIPIDDSVPEQDETVVLRIESGAGYICGASSSASLLILDDDSSTVTATVNVFGTQDASEPYQSGYYTFTRDIATNSLTVYYWLDTAGSTAGSSDYYSPSNSGSVTFSPGQSSVTLPVAPADDSQPESNETLILRLGSGSGYIAGASSAATVLIHDNDSASVPVVSIAPSQNAAEPAQPGSVVFSRSSDTAGYLTVGYSVDIYAGTASYSDFSQPSSMGTITFVPGESTVTLSVVPYDDSLVEPDETFVVRIESGSGYSIGGSGTASILILDDDTPTVSIEATQEAWEPAQNGYFTISRDKTSQYLTVFWAIDAAGTATAGSDYTSPYAYGTAYFEPGVASVTVPVTTADDTLIEPTEYVRMSLQPGSGYHLAATVTADLAILDNDTDTVGPWVAQSTPSGTSYDPMSRFTLTFSETIQDGSFTAQDVVSLTGPAGPITSFAVNKLSGTQYEVLFAEQTQLGTYSLTVGPEILDVLSNPMNQDGDGTNGETLDDRYSCSVTLVNAVPTVDLDANNSSGASGTGYWGSFVEDGPAVAVADLDATIVDPDGLTLAGLTAALAARPDGQAEVLSTDTAGTAITAVYADGVLTLSGSDTLDHYQTVLRTIRYQNTLDEPTPGDRTIIVTVSDGLDNSPAATATIAVQAVNDPPVATAQSATTDEDAPLVLTLTGSDEDPQVQTLLFAIARYPAHGRLVDFDPLTGFVVYIPGQNYNGADSFSFTVTDDATAGGPAKTSAAATVTIAVAAVNDAPTATPRIARANRNAAITLQLAGDDGDPERVQTLTFAIADAPLHGTLSALDAATGSVMYTPNPNYSGTDSFSFTVTDDATAGGAALTSTAAVVSITVLGDDLLPLPVDDSYALAEDQLLIVPAAQGVLANDSDPDQDALTVRVVAPPQHGTLSLRSDGRFLFIPEVDFSGTDSFVYEVDDGRGGIAQATATITVTAVNDAPLAQADFYRTTGGAAFAVNAAEGLLANDLDVDDPTLDAVLVAGPAHGTLALEEDGSFTYTPAAGFVGTDTFTYRAADSAVSSAAVLVTIVVAPPNAPPVAANDSYTIAEDTELVVFSSSGVLANDTDTDSPAITAALIVGPAHGTLTLAASGSLRYLPEANFAGTDSFTYTAGDGRGQSAPATVTITVTPVNDAPIAVADTAQTDEDTPVSIGVTANDADPEGAPLWIAVLSASGGTAVVHSGGTPADPSDDVVVFTPQANFHGRALFTYRVGDGALNSNTATVSVTVNAVYDPPLAVADAAMTIEDTPVTIAVLANDSCVEGGDVAIVLVGATHGAATVDNSGTPQDWHDDRVRFVPEANFSGTAEVQYKLGDGTGESSIVTVTIAVTAINDVPVATDDYSLEVLSTAPSFSYDPREVDASLAGYTGTLTVYCRLVVHDAAHAIVSQGAWSSAVTMLLEADPSASAAIAVSEMTLKHDTGYSSQDRLTTDPTLVGRVLGDFAGGHVAVEFDHDSDHQAIAGSVQIATSGGSFEYDPRVAQPALAGATGPLTVYYRTVHYDSGNQVLATGDWQSLSMTLENPPASNATVAGLALLNDTGTSASDRITSDPTLVGTVSTTAGAKVQFDHNGDGTPEATVAVVKDGRFTYIPDGLPYNQPVTLRARVLEYSASYDAYLIASSWQTILFTLRSDPPPPIAEIVLVNDTGTSDSDKITRDPTLAGRLPEDSDRANVQIDFYPATGETPLGTTFTDADGYFAWTPTGIAAGSVTLRARSARWDQEAQTIWYGPFTSFTFTYEAPQIATVAELKLHSDTGASPGDRITSDSVLVGRLAAPGPIASVSVEFDVGGNSTIDGYATTDSLGYFRFEPVLTSLGPVTVRARASVWDENAVAFVGGAWTTLDFTLVAPQEPLATVPELALLRDTGTSASDRITADPSVVGRLADDDSTAFLTVQFDHNADGTPDGSVQADAEGRFTYTPAGLAQGPHTLRARAREWDGYLEQYVFGPWTTLAITLDSPSNQAPAVSQLFLQSDTGASASDGVTANSLLVGQVSDDGPLAMLTVEFDHNGDGTPDGHAFTDAAGRFHYLPVGLAYGQHTLRARAVEWDSAQQTYLTGSWTTLAFTFEDQPDTPAAVASLGLARDTGTSAGDGITADATLVGTVRNERFVEGIAVELHFGGTLPDQTAVVDAMGSFSLAPVALAAGPVTVQARARETNPQTGAVLVGQWTTFTFTYQPAANLPAAVSEFSLVSDTGASSTDRSTTDSRLQGQITNDGILEGLVVEFDHNADGVIDGTAQVDSQGRFTYAPVLAVGSWTVRARVREPRTDAAPLLGDWTSLQFTLEAPPAASLSVSNLHLAGDTGTPGDGATNIATLAGHVNLPAGSSSVSVEMDANGDGQADATATCDASGNFSCTPAAMSEGLVTVQVRASCVGADGMDYGPWQSLSFVYYGATLGEAGAHAMAATWAVYRTDSSSSEALWNSVSSAADTDFLRLSQQLQGAYDQAVGGAGTARAQQEQSAQQTYQTALAQAGAAYSTAQQQFTADFQQNLAGFTSDRTSYSLQDFTTTGWPARRRLPRPTGAARRPVPRPPGRWLLSRPTCSGPATSQWLGPKARSGSPKPRPRKTP